jgi:hypothetical protein
MLLHKDSVPVDAPKLQPRRMTLAPAVTENGEPVTCTVDTPVHGTVVLGFVG